MVQTSQLHSPHRKTKNNFAMLAVKQASANLACFRCRLHWSDAKINVRRCVVHIRKSHICANLVEVQNKQPFRTAAPKPKSFHWMLVSVWKVFSHWVYGTQLLMLEAHCSGRPDAKTKTKTQCQTIESPVAR